MKKMYDIITINKSELEKSDLFNNEEQIDMLLKRHINKKLQICEYDGYTYGVLLHDLERTQDRLHHLYDPNLKQESMLENLIEVLIRDIIFYRKNNYTTIVDNYINLSQETKQNFSNFICVNRLHL